MAEEDIRATILGVIDELARQGTSLQFNTVLVRASQRLGRRDLATDQALLTLFYDLFRIGYLCWGHDVQNAEFPFFHVTTLGREALAHRSRDPANPDGYVEHLKGRAHLNPVTESYVTEALNTFNAGCVKATAVMVGAAAESLVLGVRDALVARFKALDHTVPTGLTDWRIRRILDALETAILAKKAIVPVALFERFQANWPTVTHQIRTARNEAGHPVRVDPVTAEEVHAALLVFPELATLATQLTTWINTDYAPG